MDISSVLIETDSWPLEERVRLVEVLWDRIVESEHELDLTPAQKAELDRRLADLEAHPENVVPWDEVVARLRRPR